MFSKSDFCFKIFGILFFATALVICPWGASFLLKFPLTSFSPFEFIFLLGFSIIFLLLAFVCFCKKEQAPNYLLMLSVVLVMLFIAERIIASMPHAQFNDMVTIADGEDTHAVCYPYAPGTMLPIHLKEDKKSKEWLCVEDHPRLRKAGYFPQRKDKVLLVGDSFTYGGGVPEDQTLAFYLSLVFPKKNFINYGKSGAQTREIQDILSQTLSEQPQIKHVIYFFNINDVLVYGPVSQQQKLINDLELVRIYRIKKFSSPIGQWLSQFALFRMINQVVMLNKETRLTVKNYLDSYDASKNPRGVKETQQALIDMNQIVKSRGGVFVVVMYPLLYRTPDGRYPFSTIHEHIEKVCKQNGIIYLDGYEAFKAEKSLKPLQVHPILDYHPNGKANKLMVEYLFKIDAIRAWLNS